MAPAEIENCLLQHEAVLECAVIGTRCWRWTHKTQSFIVLRDGYHANAELTEEIKEFVKSRIALYKYPRWIEFVASLPKNDRGKIDRRKLKDSSR